MSERAPISLDGKGARRPRARSRAFTLIELLVVVGLIGLIATGFGLALSDTGGSSLATGQTLLSTMVGTARSQAAMNQTQAVIAIYGTRPPSGEADKYLRLMQVFRNETPTAASPKWVSVGTPVALPRGVYVVPPSTNGLLGQGVVWSSNPPLLSTVGTAFNPGQITGTPFGTNPTAFYLGFTADGVVSTDVRTWNPIQSYARLIIATATLANNIPQFNNASAVRGLLIRPSGAITFANDVNSF